MARLPRLFAPSVPQHVVQRSAEGRTICVDAADYAFLLVTIEQAARQHGLSLHAYVLLPKEIQLLATPAAADSLPRVMQDIGRRYVPHANARAGRPGALWNGRFRSTLIDPEAYLLPVMRHIERRPVATGEAARPTDWRWSSHGHHVGDLQEAAINDHAAYWALSDTPFGRQAAYRQAMDATSHEGATDPIEAAVDRGWALGDPAFVAAIERLANRRAAPMRRGRRKTR